MECWIKWIIHVVGIYRKYPMIWSVVNFPPQNSQKTPHSWPVGVRYGVSFMDPASDWYSALVPVIIYAVSYNIGPCHNDTELYL